MSRRVVVTGMGVVTPVGVNVDEMWNNLLNGVSGIGEITKFDTTEYPSKIAGNIKDFNISEEILDLREQKRTDIFTQFAVAAFEEAIVSSDLDLENAAFSESIGVVIGTGIGGIETLTSQHEVLIKRGPRRVSPLTIPKMIGDIASCYISIKYNIKGPNYAITSACASSSHAIEVAADIIKNGYADIMVSGGSEAPIIPLALAGFCSARSLSTRNDEPTRASRPFDKDRDGFVIAEGSGIMILEELEHARKRGAPIYAEIKGYAANADAYNVTAPSPEGEGGYNVMKQAIGNGGYEISDIDYINTHGTATSLGDIAEAKAIARLFSPQEEKPLINSSKSMLGHLLGAAGAVEGVIAIKSILENKIHPTVNLENRDPECKIDVHAAGVKEKEIKLALSNSFGFGGHNASILFGELDR